VFKAPDGYATTLTSDAIDVVVAPKTCTAGTLAGSVYSCVDGETTQVPLTLDAECVVDSLVGQNVVFGTVPSGPVSAFTIGAAYTGPTASVAVTLVDATTRARVEFALGAYKFPTSVEYTATQHMTVDVQKAVTATFNTPLVDGTVWSASVGSGQLAQTNGTLSAATGLASVALAFTPSASDEITPKSVRLRKRFLKEHERKKAGRA
jgi:hypothetical protein